MKPPAQPSQEATTTLALWSLGELACQGSFVVKVISYSIDPNFYNSKA